MPYADKERGALFSIWRDIRRRCEDPRDKSYPNYGGRGIRLCNRWKWFPNFVADMSPRPSSKHSVDRVDNERGYSPENCRWATQREQARNSRKNRRLTFAGVTRTMSEWAEHLGMSPKTLSARLNDYDWTVERALSEPVRGCP